MSKIVVAVGAMACAMLLVSMAAVLTAVEGAGTPRTVTLVGAGDIAQCDEKSDRKTARLLGKIGGTVFTLGDHAYPDGTRAQFRDCYDPTWGKYKKRTRPSVGNHDYHTAGRSPTSITSDGGRGGPGATTPTIGEPGTSWSSTATARRSVGVTGAPPKGAGSAESWPTTEGGARWPTSTTRSTLPEEAKIAPR